MRPFRYLDQHALLDMLAYVTARYTKLYSNSMDQNDFIACRELLHLLQLEIQLRNSNRDIKHLSANNSSDSTQPNN